MLRKYEKVIIQTIEKTRPAVGVEWFETETLFRLSGLSFRDFREGMGACERDDFLHQEGNMCMLTDRGFGWREVLYLERRQRWLDRLWGFITGVLIALVPQLVSWLK